MLQITIPSNEILDEKTGQFVQVKEQTLCLEHSLISISKWESKWRKPFLTAKEKTNDEIFDYIKCMTLNKGVDDLAYLFLTMQNIKEINEYINAPMTATYFSKELSQGGRGSSEQVTSELIYYWMIALNIPVEFEKWHINRLLTLIRVCEVKNQPPKKLSRGEIIRRNAAINAARRKQLNTKG